MEEIKNLMTQLNRSYLRILTRMIRGTRFLKKERPPKPISRPRKMILHVRADSPANGTYQSLPLYHKRLQDKWLTQKTGSAKREVSNFLWKDTMESHVLTSTHGCAQVEEKCSFLKTPEDEIGRWSKVHLEGNALALISRLGISDWKDIKSNLQHQFIPRHNNTSILQWIKLVGIFSLFESTMGRNLPTASSKTTFHARRSLRNLDSFNEKSCHLDLRMHL